MSLIAIIIIFICIGIDNMVSANMSALNMSAEDKSVFSIKMALFFTGFNVLAFMISYLLSAITHNWIVQARLVKSNNLANRLMHWIRKRRFGYVFVNNRAIF